MTFDGAARVLKWAAPLALLAMAACGAPHTTPAPLTPAGKLRLDNVTVVDVRDGALTPGMSVLMDAGRIVSVAPTRDSPADPAIEVVDGAGKFVVPGYNDMHSHAAEASSDPSGIYALMLADGVTGFRQMSGSSELLQRRGDGALPAGADAPAMLVMPGAVLTPFNAGSEEAVRGEIQQQFRDGADFIKVAVVSPAVFYAAIDAARDVGLPIVGHLQAGVDALEAAQRGFHAVEHLGPGDAMWIGCSSAAAELRAEAASRPVLRAPPFEVPFLDRIAMAVLKRRLVNPAAFEDPVDVARLQRAFDTYDEAACVAQARGIAAAGQWHTPTLVRLRTQELADAPEYESDPALAYMPPGNVETWRAVTRTFHGLPAETRATFAEAYARHLALVKLLDDAGVQMMVGTDSGGGEVPGQSIHQEFDELAKAGLSPLRILQMTTLNAATFLGRSDTMGRVAPGMNADLVVLGANPVEDAQALHAISAVVRAGHYRPRAELDALRARVRAGQGTLR